MPIRPHDLVLLGATGFTGRIAAHWLARHVGAAHRWALAGRSQDKLEAVRASLGPAFEAIPLVVVDTGDATSVDRMVESTKVVVSTAGPFALHGTPVVAACARHATHYCDINGEPLWVREMIDRFDAEARASGARIVPGCGFDSVPSDLGAWMMARHLRSTHDEAIRSLTARFRVHGRAAFNGGTLATMQHMLALHDRAWRDDPYLLTPRKGSVRPVDLHAAVDAADGTWSAPFFMAWVNRTVVHRSQFLAEERGQAYGQDFEYDERLIVRSSLQAKTMALGMRVVDRFDPRALAALLRSFGNAPGTGPSEEEQQRGSFTVDLVATGERGTPARGRIESQGDPGNTSTVRMLCASALCLLEDLDRLPAGGGLLTPAVALGDALIERLRVLGMRWKVTT